MGLLRRLNPTASLLRASSFVARHDYIFALLCLLNVNMGALDLSVNKANPNNSSFDEENDISENDSSIVEAYYAHSLLHDMAAVHASMEPEAQVRVLNRVIHSGALPVSRDTPSFSAVKSMLEGGSGAGQVEYIRNVIEKLDMEYQGGEKERAQGKANPAMGATMDEDMFRKNLRAEAKQRAAQVGVGVGVGVIVEIDNGIAEEKEEECGGEEEAEEKQNSDELKKEKKKKKKKKQIDSLLGELPSLSKMGMGNFNSDTRSKKELIELDLELPEKMAKARKKKSKKNKELGKDKEEIFSPAKGNNNSGIPEEFACAINGHLMKEPVRTPDGLVFEKATILLWLETRGSVCPISGNDLTVADLEEAQELQSMIKIFVIKKTNNGSGGEGGVRGLGGGGGGRNENPEQEDDVYDF